MLDRRTTQGRAVVIGAGAMGSGIAALLANTGWTVDLLDLPSDATDPGGRNSISAAGLDRALTARPPAFMLPEHAHRVCIGNTEDDLGRIAAADWVVEAVAECAAVKRALFNSCAAHMGPTTVLSSNTSGLGLSAMVQDCSPSIRSRFLGTHFFNPPTTMRPIELVHTSETDPAVLEGFSEFADHVLGKRVIRAKESPGFISTRLGIVALVQTLALTQKHGMTVEETDYLTGPLLGRPRSGSGRLADIIGLDIIEHIIHNLKNELPTDSVIHALDLPPMMRTLVLDGRLGAKSGAGYYRRQPDGSLEAIDLETGIYRAAKTADLVDDFISTLPLRERLVSLWDFPDTRYRDYLRDVLITTIGYMSSRAMEVADRIVEVDDALMLGYGWDLGPFMLLDIVPELREAVPASAPIEAYRRSSSQWFYTNAGGTHFYLEIPTAEMQPLPRPEGVIVLKDAKKRGAAIVQGESWSLTDIGEGIVCFDWRGKMNVLDLDIVEGLNQSRRLAEAKFAGLVIGAGSAPFSAGFDLRQFAALAEAAEWKAIEAILVALQECFLGLSRSRVPVVAAVAGYSLGGACEMLLRCHGVQAAFESRIGLPEANVGLIPAAGGVTAMLRRANQAGGADPFDEARSVWRTLCSGAYSCCADDARSLGFLRSTDGISRNPDRILGDARRRAIWLSMEHRPVTDSPIKVLGPELAGQLEMEIQEKLRSGLSSQHDARVYRAVAAIMSGGAALRRCDVPEQYLLDVEREQFLSLCGTPETLARIHHMLDTGKALRN